MDYIGVHVIGYKKYAVRLHVKNCTICVGVFSDELEAARAYNEAALRYLGPGTLLNRVPK